VPGYLNNARIALALDALELKPGVEAMEANMIQCYQAMIDLKVVDARELNLLHAWFTDLRALRTSCQEKDAPGAY
jgi:hypothetical protein